MTEKKNSSDKLN